MKGKEGVVLKRLHNLHRQAMKAALRINRRRKVSDSELYSKTGQYSLLQAARNALGNMTVNCMQNWEGHPMTAARIE